MAEWLRRLTRNQIPSGSVGSNPTDCADGIFARNMRKELSQEGTDKDWLYAKEQSCIQQARLAQSVEHETLNLRVVGSSPTLGDQSFSDVLNKTMSNNFGSPLLDVGDSSSLRKAKAEQTTASFQTHVTWRRGLVG